MFFRIEMPNASAEDEFRIFTAEDSEAVQKNYAPNINRSWAFWQEYRVRNEHTDGTFFAMFRLPLAGRKNLRLQIMRYGGVWNRFDLWSPTLRPIADFPVSRFGRVIFDTGEK